MKLAGREPRPIAGKCIYVPLFAPFFLLQETVYETVKPKKPAMTPNPASASRSWRPMRQPFKDEKTMSPKPPPRGTVTVDIHPRPGLPSDAHAPLPDTLPRVDFGLPITTNPRNPSRTIGTPGDGDLDAITPAPPVTVSEIPSVPEVPASTASQRPLAHYWVASTVKLPPPDALGFRTFKGR